jgi:5-methylthioadenosine/S-adenosylhomocysteine deaminase
MCIRDSFKGTEFYINLDKVDQPDLGYFLEVKSRTWSRRDAEHKAQVGTDLLEFLGASLELSMTKDYIEMVMDRESSETDH